MNFGLRAAAAGITVILGFLAPIETQANPVLDKVLEVENGFGGEARVGIAVLDTDSGAQWGYRQNERFPMASTFKSFACAAVLDQVDKGHLALSKSMPIEQKDMVRWAPVTHMWLGSEMTLGDLCHASVTMSDNVAANKTIEAVGSPEKITEFMRGMGDDVTRMDRWELELNEAAKGDPRDTTTPAQAVASLRKIVSGGVLSDESTRQFNRWMHEQAVADKLLRLHLPDGWQIEDKSGGGRHGSRSIIATVRPPERLPIYIAIYITYTKQPLGVTTDAVAQIGKVLFDELQR